MRLRGVLILLVAALFSWGAGYGQTMAMPGVNAAAQVPASKWATTNGTVALKDFRFGTGESLPELKLHYLTLGSPHRDAAGHVDNAVLLLHGTGGNAHSLMKPVLLHENS